VPSISASPDTNKVIVCPSTIPKKCFASPSVSGALRQPMEIDVEGFAAEQQKYAPSRIMLIDTEPEDDTISLFDAVQAFSRAGLAWDEKLALFEEVQFSLDEGTFLSMAAEHEDGSHELLNKFMRILAEGMGDAHFKVCGAALETLSEALRSPQLTPTLEAHVETFSPGLFVRITDPKEQIRQLAGTAAELLPQVLNPDAVMHGLAAALNSAKAPKVLCAVMDFYADLVTVGTCKGRDPADSGPARAMLAGCLPLATHKRQDVRQSALGAVAAVYFAGPQSAGIVRSAIEIMPPKSADAIKRGISQNERQKSVEPEKEKTATTPVRPPFELPSPASSSGPPVSASASGQRMLFSPSPVSPLALQECPPSPLDQDMFHEEVPQLAIPPAKIGNNISGRTPTPPPSVRTIPSPDSVRCSLPHGTVADADRDAVAIFKEKDSPMAINTVSIIVDATSNFQAAVPSPPPPPSWNPAAVEEVDILIAKLQQPMPSAAAMSEALALAPRLEGEDRAALCSAVQESLLVVFEKGVHARVDALEAGMTTYAEFASLIVPSSLSAFPHSSPVKQVFKQVLLAQGHENEAVAFAAEKCAQQILGSLDSASALDLLVPLLPETNRRPPFEGDRAILSHGVLRLLKMILPSMTNLQISEVLSTIIPPSCVCYTSANAELRRAAVDFIVAVHLRLGDEVVAPHTETLSLAQVKLIEIYVERARRAVQ
jgi:CLIP-associating protein 1/2